MEKKKDKQAKPETVSEPTLLNVFAYIRPEIFAFFKSVYDKRKAELKAKLDNRQTKEEKELLITDERKKIVGQLESHPLFVIFPLVSKPFTEGETLAKGLISGLPTIFMGANTESELKAKETVLPIINKYMLPDSNTDDFDFNTIIKQLGELPQAAELLKDIPQSEDPVSMFAYHLISMDGDSQYIKHLIKTYEALQTPEIKPTEPPKREIAKFQTSKTEKEPGELENLIQTNVRQILSEKGLENNMPASDILSIAQACEFLKLAKQTIYGFTSKNEIPFIKKGKKLYFKKTELEQWLLDGRQKTHREIRADAIELINNLKKRKK